MGLEGLSQKIYDILMSSSYANEAEEINNLMSKVLILNEIDPVRFSAIESLLSRCHPRWLGDYYVKNFSYAEWISLITQFKTKLLQLKLKQTATIKYKKH